MSPVQGTQARRYERPNPEVVTHGSWFEFVFCECGSGGHLECGRVYDLRSGGVGRLYLDGRNVVGVRIRHGLSLDRRCFPIGTASPGFFVEFTSGFDLGDFLPASGIPGPLNADLENPTTTSAGIFAGQVAGLKLNIDFSAAGFLPGTSGLHFGDLVLTGFSGTDSSLNGLTASQFLSLTNTALGGGDTGFTFPDLDTQLAELNNAFDDGGQPDSFAQDHLVAPGSSVAMPEPPTLLLAAVGVLAAAIFRKKRVLGRPVGV